MIRIFLACTVNLWSCTSQCFVSAEWTQEISNVYLLSCSLLTWLRATFPKMRPFWCSIPGTQRATEYNKMQSCKARRNIKERAKQISQLIWWWQLQLHQLTEECSQMANKLLCCLVIFCFALSFICLLDERSLGSRSPSGWSLSSELSNKEHKLHRNSRAWRVNKTDRLEQVYRTRQHFVCSVKTDITT